MKFAIRALLFIALSSIGFAKPPVTEGETDPVMLDLDPYMIDALRGGKSQETGKNIPPGRFGSEGGLADLLQEDAFNKLVKKARSVAFQWSDAWRCELKFRSNLDQNRWRSFFSSSGRRGRVGDGSHFGKR